MKLKPSPQALFLILKDAALAFSQDNAPRLAAATAYYAISSIGPLVFLAIASAGIFLNGKVSDPTFVDGLSQKVIGVARNILGTTDPETLQRVAEFVRTLLDGVSKQFENGGANTLALLTGFVTLFMTATGLFAQFQGALNSMWGVQPKVGFVAMVRSRVVGFLLVVTFSALVLAFIAGNTYLSVLMAHLGDAAGIGGLLTRLISGLLAMLFFTPVFAALYKWLPAVRLRWSQVLVGGAVTSVLFVLSQAFIGMYFARATPGSIYGGASTLFIILLWIYFSSMVIFFGAEVTWVYSQYADGHLLDASGQPISKATSQLPVHPLPRGEVRPVAPPLARPSLISALVNALVALLAIPSVIALRLLGNRQKSALRPQDFRFRQAQRKRR